MQLPVDYLDLLLIAAGALVFLLGLFLLRRRELGQSTSLERALRTSQSELTPRHHDLLMPLLLVEEEYPVFGEVIALVIARCGVHRLVTLQEFQEPATYLSEAAFKPSEPGIEGALCHIVRGLLQDPDIEYSCRPELSPLIDQFIDELDDSRAAKTRRKH